MGPVKDARGGARLSRRVWLRPEEQTGKSERTGDQKRSDHLDSDVGGVGDFEVSNAEQTACETDKSLFREEQQSQPCDEGERAQGYFDDEYGE